MEAALASADLLADTAAPTEESTPVDAADPGLEQSGDHLLILDSAWTVAAA
ncbi:hypothetical protein ACPCVO_35165 [Streptomyces umbrinus]|uniref:hypothetical protein n=1 Tax=Streptomyces umbrinus TaxID=67370 RepID=UPI003C2DDB14